MRRADRLCDPLLQHQDDGGVREPHLDDKGTAKRWSGEHLSLERSPATPKGIAVGMQLGKTASIRFSAGAACAHGRSDAMTLACVDGFEYAHAVGLAWTLEWALSSLCQSLLGGYGLFVAALILSALNGCVQIRTL
jgi:hypothetical protein